MPQDPRLERLRARLADDGVDAIALTAVPNVRYVTGFADVFDEEPAHVALVSSRDATLFTDSRFYAAALAASEGTPWRVELATEGVPTAACSALKADGATRLALEATLEHGRFLAFAEKFCGEVVCADGWVEAQRSIKDARETAAIERAQALTDRAFVYLLTDVLRKGVSERETALLLEVFLRREGSEGVAFSPIVASGPNSARPHATPGNRAFLAGDFVVLDFGARVDGYCSDMTRTVVIGSASAEQREIYDAVLSANEAGISAARAGLTGAQIDAAARAVIAERGFGDRFGHGLGHGVGLEVHELPSVGPRGEAVIRAGSVITIEPGVYIPGFGGVRIEDLAVVEEGGVRVLTQSTKDLLEL